MLFRLEPLKLQPVTTEWHCRDNFMAKMQIKMIYKQAVHSVRSKRLRIMHVKVLRPSTVFSPGFSVVGPGLAVQQFLLLLHQNLYKSQKI